MSILSIGAMNQLGDALEKAGFSAEDVTKLKQFNNLKGIKDIINGRATISYSEHLIDLSAEPFCPDGWLVSEHQGTGNWQLDLSAPLYLSERQEKGIEGRELREELEDKKVLNANVLDYLLAHPELIPEEWKDKIVFFWGTIYRSHNGALCVRCLGWRRPNWDWGSRWLGSVLGSGYFAAVAS